MVDSEHFLFGLLLDLNEQRLLFPVRTYATVLSTVGFDLKQVLLHGFQFLHSLGIHHSVKSGCKYPKTLVCLSHQMA